MLEISTNNRRIAKNTLLLYFRTLIVMLVSLYTSRIVLRVLGVEDYGIYNVVGGVVAMLSFITATLSTAAQRYIAYELPSENLKRQRETFSLILLSFTIVFCATLVLSETIGVWFLNASMNIPHDRMVAANIVLQTSIWCFLLNIMVSPYMALIIAHEHMGVYAYISIVDTVLKLVSVYLLQIIFFDSLIVYAVLLLLCTTIITIFYIIYCKKHFIECKFNFFYDRRRLREIISFAWWNTLGALANTLRGQGIDILLNLFFSPIVNAARAIAVQVGTAVNLFATNFFTAVRSQIIMSYSVGDLKRMHSLILNGSRLLSLLLIVLIVPLLLNTDYILHVWLVNIPDYAVTFVRLMLLCSLIEAPLGPLLTGIQATGRMKEYNLIVSVIYLLNLPFSYVVLKVGCSPESTLYVTILLAVFSIAPRLYLSKKFFGLSIIQYFREVFVRCIMISVICVAIGYLMKMLIGEDNFIMNGIMFLLTIVETAMIVMLIGLKTIERDFMKNKLIGYVKASRTFI